MPPHVMHYLFKEVEGVVEAAHVSATHASHAILQTRLSISAGMQSRCGLLLFLLSYVCQPLWHEHVHEKTAGGVPALFLKINAHHR